MEKDILFLIGHFKDLARRAQTRDGYTFTDFLGLSEQNVLHSLNKELQTCYELFGGAESCERVIARFGNENMLGYSQGFPIDCLKVEFPKERYVDKISHRDILGALMSLGIERSLTGDIILNDDGVFLFCKDSISGFICDNLCAIRNSAVTVSRYEGSIEIKQRTQSEVIQLPSERTDVLISRAFRLSRDESAKIIRAGKVFIDGREVTSTSSKPKEGDIVSVRGLGRIRYFGSQKTTKKGNLMVEIERFI